MTADKCRPVEVDGEVIRVRGALPMTEQGVAYLADIVRAAKRKMAADACPGCEHPLKYHDGQGCHVRRPAHCPCGAL